MRLLVKKDGTKEITEPLVKSERTAAELEREWRDIELNGFVDPYQLYPSVWHLQSQANKDAIANYAQALRDWPDHANFPDPAYRPVRPIL